ncbi:MAG TPA: WXG100 family type VII secretion target [Trebonia sp.]|jgi:WXG100 family type VII secretion target|nr:WXG100 family type VII secretion target [Trebonia sp.]
MGAGNDYTRVMFGAMEQGQGDFQRTYASLQSEIQHLESQLQGNLGEWVGTAQAAYHEAQTVWNAAMVNMQGVLQQLGTVIGTANDNYQQAESVNAARWS